MKVLVCGGREYSDYSKMHDILMQYRIDLLISGGSRGADTLAIRYASEYSIPTHIILANWNKYGKSAGPRRNMDMLRTNPDIVIAFKGGKGTAFTVAKAKEMGIKVIEVA